MDVCQTAAISVEGIVLGSATISPHRGVVVLVAVLCGRTAVALSHYTSSLHLATPCLRDETLAEPACSPIITPARPS